MLKIEKMILKFIVHNIYVAIHRNKINMKCISKSVIILHVWEMYWKLTTV